MLEELILRQGVPINTDDFLIGMGRYLYEGEIYVYKNSSLANGPRGLIESVVLKIEAYFGDHIERRVASRM